MMSTQVAGAEGRPLFVQDILSGDEDAVLSFQLAVRYSLRLRGEKLASHDSGKPKAKVSSALHFPSLACDRDFLPLALAIQHVTFRRVKPDTPERLPMC